MRRQPALGTRSAITTDCDPVPPPDLLEKQLGRPETPHRPALSLQEVEMSAQELQPPPRGRPPLEAGGEEGDPAGPAHCLLGVGVAEDDNDSYNPARSAV